MTHEQIEELKALEAAATQGPWKQAKTEDEALDWWGKSATSPESVIVTEGLIHVLSTNDDGFVTEKECADAAFVAALRNSAKELIAAAEEAEKLRAEVVELRKDSDRLNWLGYVCHGFVRGTNFSQWKLESPSEGIRVLSQAIDAAMEPK